MNLNLTARQRTYLISVGIVLILGLVFFLINRAMGSGGATTAGSHQFGVQTKTSGCKAHAGLPDSACTPGAILSTGTKSAICKSGYASSVRNVPDSEKNQDYAEYGITSHATGEYEVDHLVSLELGGSNEHRQPLAGGGESDPRLPSERSGGELSARSGLLRRHQPERRADRDRHQLAQRLSAHAQIDPKSSP